MRYMYALSVSARVCEMGRCQRVGESIRKSAFSTNYKIKNTRKVKRKKKML